MYTAISWFTKSPVASNLLMWFLLIAGVMALFTVNQEEFPNMEVQVVTISVPYLGAAPEEVENGVCVRIEEAIEGVEGIDRLRSTASEGVCSVMAELDLDADEIKTLNEIKSKVDAINSFPVETEKPIVAKATMTRRVVQIAVYGDTDERVLKEIATDMRDDIVALKGISKAHVSYIRPYEISIEVPESQLRRFGLSLTQVSQAVRKASLDMPGGTIKTEGGEILIRTTGQAYWAEEFAKVVIVTNREGTRVTLGEIANIRDTFEEGDLVARFNGKPAVVINVSQVGKEDLIDIAASVREYLAKVEPTMPQGISLTTWIDTSHELTERLDTLNKNAGSGLLLVLIVLALFLKFRLAMWVAFGIPIALLGTIAMFPYADITISTMTVMAFILVLGIVVDDAIVVGERVYGHEQMGKPPIQAAIDGTWEVSVPVIFGVLTTMAAFLPLVLVEGRMSGFFSVIGVVVIIALFFSIVESQLILPAHLARRRRDRPRAGVSAGWNGLQSKLSTGLENFASNLYMPFVAKTVQWRYAAAAVGIGVLILAIALIASGRVIFGFFPSVEGNRVYASLEMPAGSPSSVTVKGAQRMEAAAYKVNEDLAAEFNFAQPVIRHVLSSIGTQVDRDGPGRPPGPGQSHIAEIAIDLIPLSERGNMSAKDIASRWREAVGGIPDAVSLTFDASAFDAGEAINYQLNGKDVDSMRAAANQLKAELSRYDGVFDISDTFRAGKQEIQMSLLPEARNLGLTLSDLASQVRNAFYGTEAQRIQRGQDDVRVMIRFPESERKSIGNLEDMYIRTPDGSEVPFYSVARFELSRGYSSIQRVDGRRVVNVIGDVDRAQVTPEEINSNITTELLPKLAKQFPDIEITLGGEQEERADALGGLAQGAVLSLILIFGLLAIPLRSYFQPLVIMSVIPFGAVGAIFGHWIMGVDLMFFSVLGIVALSGVVVNASLVLVDYINRQRREGKGTMESVLSACVVRFRPIMLTSVTTFVGLIPLMTNRTPATGPFVPMAVSLAWGVLFATFITLLLVPSLYMIVEDWLAFLEKFRRKDPVDPDVVPHDLDEITGASHGSTAG